MIFRLLLASLILVSLTACQASPKIKASDAEFFLNEALRSWSYPVGEYPKQLVPLILDLEHNGQSIDAVVTLQLGFHPMRYLVFSGGTVYINGLYWGRFTYKGRAEYDPQLLQGFIDATEAVGDCELWGEKSNLDYLGDLLAYPTQSGTRFCIQSGAWGGKSSILNTMFQEFPDKDITWSLAPSKAD